MKQLDRLLVAAGTSDTPAKMPFGFDTRVLALARAQPRNGSALLARFASRASALALVIIAFGAIGVYRSNDSSDDTADYSMADTAIENNLSE